MAMFDNWDDWPRAAQSTDPPRERYAMGACDQHEVHALLFTDGRRTNVYVCHERHLVWAEVDGTVCLSSFRLTFTAEGFGSKASLEWV